MLNNTILNILFIQLEKLAFWKCYSLGNVTHQVYHSEYTLNFDLFLEILPNPRTAQSQLVAWLCYVHLICEKVVFWDIR